MTAEVTPAQSRFPAVPAPPSPYFAPMQAYCLSLPGAWEDYPWGDIIHKVGNKMFAGSGQREGGDLSVTVKATLDDQAALVQMPGVSVARYVGKHGWITVTITDEASLQFALDLINASYELVAHPPKKARARRYP